MNAPDDNDDELRCAEYALGVLDADERQSLERDASIRPALMSRLVWWQARLSPLAEDLSLETPPDHVWERIAQTLRDSKSRPPARNKPVSLWDNLAMWRWLGVGASAAALAMLVITLRFGSPVPGTTQSASTTYLVATIARQDGVAHWTATIAPGTDRLIIVPADRPTIATGRTTELWLIQANAKPVPLGVFDPVRPATMPLSREIVDALGRAQAVLAVSIEPPGGSPTGQPTGPVVATGDLHPA
ncbi:anti-sigma factor [Pandoraea faecigallinarum]|uniref:Anti-sigma factor n=1 Tax=Pandoraea faecigallinarum TaxID=656179 RepID=A0A0H3WW80_9BURK|nr:anti-sigma factor [Pandoraea faecigallinarum]AKM31997.1 anti-sigma factor [Pandoraea faecigallinarum]